MERFSYKTKLTILREMQTQIETLRKSLSRLNDNEELADVPNFGDFYGLSVHIDALMSDVDSLVTETHPSAFFERRSI